MKSFEEVIHELVMANNAKAIAEELNKPYSTFMREVNPHDFDAKFGASCLIPLTRATGDFAAIDYIEQALGRVAFVLPKKKMASNQMYEKVASMTKEFGELLAAVGESLHDGHISEEELDRCKKEGYETLQALAHMMEALANHGGK